MPFPGTPLIVMPTVFYPRIYDFAVITFFLLLTQPPTTRATPQAVVPAQQQPTSPNPPQRPTTAPALSVPPLQDDKPGQASPTTTSKTPKEQAWQTLESGYAGSKTSDRALAIRVLSLLPNDSKAVRVAVKALKDNKTEVRAAAAAALGDMNSRKSIPKLRLALDDTDPSVALAAAHALELMHDDSAYEVYYEVLNGERKTGKSLIASQTSILSDPKKMAQLGFEEGIGFIPFAGIGWGAIKAITKDDTSPIRAAAAKALAKDPDPATTKALTDAAGDKSWLVRAAALEALAKRGDPSVLETVKLYMDDEKAVVKYTAAAAVLRLSAVKEAGSAVRQRKKQNTENPRKR